MPLDKPNSMLPIFCAEDFLFALPDEIMPHVDRRPKLGEIQARIDDPGADDYHLIGMLVCRVAGNAADYEAGVTETYGLASRLADAEDARILKAARRRLLAKKEPTAYIDEDQRIVPDDTDRQRRRSRV
jgi:hypothetical protein